MSGATKDLIERLEREGDFLYDGFDVGILTEAASELRRLQGEVEDYRKRLEHEMQNSVGLLSANTQANEDYQARNRQLSEARELLKRARPFLTRYQIVFEGDDAANSAVDLTIDISAHLSRTKPQPSCPYCGARDNLRSPAPNDYICEGCFTGSDTGPCFDDLPKATKEQPQPSQSDGAALEARDG